MPDILESIFGSRKADPAKFLEYGFVRSGENYVLHRDLLKSGFVMAVTISPTGAVQAEIVDPAYQEPYTLHLAEGAVGSFVGGVKAEYERVLLDIAAKCFVADVFKTACARELISFVSGAYGDELEFLWDKFPKNAVWRRADTGKWYGALLTVSKRKLGIASDEVAEIIDLRASPEALGSLIDGARYYPGYHMNKKHWYTMLLDGSVSVEEIRSRIAESYLLAVK